MGDFPVPTIPPFNTIHTLSVESLGSLLRAGDGVALNALSSRANIANEARFYPFRLWEPATAVKMSIIVGATNTGNVDVGIYDSQENRLVNSGSTALGTANTLQEFNITDTLLQPGVYFMAIQFSSGSGTSFQSSNSDENFLQFWPWYMQAVGSFGLPNPANWIVSTQATIELHGIAVHFDATV